VTARVRSMLVCGLWLAPTIAMYLFVNQPRYVALSMAFSVLGVTTQIRGFVNAVAFLKERKIHMAAQKFKMRHYPSRPRLDRPEHGATIKQVGALSHWSWHSKACQ
jgi:hypothetical protein